MLQDCAKDRYGNGTKDHTLKSLIVFVVLETDAL